MNFYDQAGKMAIGSRLRRLDDMFTESAKHIYALYDVPLDPKWFPIFYVLSQQEALSITEIAQRIGHSHPSVSQIVKEMTKHGITSTAKHTSDARVNVVSLTDTGKQLIPRIEKQYRDVTDAVEGLLSDTYHNLWKAIEEVEFLLKEQDLYSRVQAQYKRRESQDVEIIDYTTEFHAAFKQLNCEWIETYFTLEEQDLIYLDHPTEKILEQGGHIFMARYQGEVVGTGALVNVDNETYELAKMAVTERARGKHIGFLLGQSLIAKAREFGAKRLLIQSNTALEAAINLYYKLGFQRIVGKPSPYEKCNIQLELWL